MPRPCALSPLDPSGGSQYLLGHVSAMNDLTRNDSLLPLGPKRFTSRKLSSLIFLKILKVIEMKAENMWKINKTLEGAGF